MNKSPNIVNFRSIVDGQYNDTTTNINNKWVTARPIGYPSFIHRLKLAWGVFRGHYDALKWPEGQ